MRYIAWQTCLTAHQYYTHIECAKALNSEQVFISRYESPVGRSENVWGEQFENNYIVNNFGFAARWRIYLNYCVNRNNFHVISSPFENFWQISIIILLTIFHGRFFIIMEPFNPKNVPYFGRQTSLEKIKHFLRPFLYKNAYSFFLRRARLVFSISPLCRAQLFACHVPKSKVIPFGYFLPKTPPLSNKRPERLDNLVFIGGSGERKGLNYLIEAWSQRKSSASTRTITCFGELQIDLPIGMNPGGVFKLGDAPQLLAGFDCVIIPSIHDGWSVVVNEAIVAGIPIICSEAVGASVIVKRLGLGKVFSSLSDLASILSSSSLHDIHVDFDEHVQKARLLVSSESAGCYFADMINGNVENCGLRDVLL